MWMAVVAAVSIAAIDFKLLRQAGRHEIAVYAVLVVLALAMSALVSWNLWPQVRLMAPFDAVFRPLTKWLYKIL
jgi:hypothetical protein